MNSKFEERRNALVEYLICEGVLVTKEIIDAFRKVPREEFVPEELKDEAYIDIPLPIGEGQTISQPTTVAIMTEALKPEKGNKILEVGAGSGYQAAILCEIVGEEGIVYTVERLKKLYEFAKKNIEKCGYKNVKLFLGDGSIGLKEFAPYDRIIVTACAPKIPEPLISQLKDGGRMVIPVGRMYGIQKLLLIKKNGENIKEENLGPFAFVPLIGKYGFKEWKTKQ